MTRYEVIVRKSVRRELKKIPTKERKRIFEVFKKLQSNPRPTKVEKLKGREDTYRIRVGIYRVIYEIHDNVLTVIVVSVGYRKDVYRNLS